MLDEKHVPMILRRLHYLGSSSTVFTTKVALIRLRTHWAVEVGPTGLRWLLVQTVRAISRPLTTKPRLIKLILNVIAYVRAATHI